MRLLLCVFGLCLAGAAAQAAVLGGARLLGGAGQDGFRDLAPAPDGGWYAVGLRQDEAAGDYDAWVVRFSAQGEVLCEAREALSGSADDAAMAVAVATDGSVFVAGTTSSSDLPVRPLGEGDLVQGTMGADPVTLEPSPSDAFLARLDADCQVQFLTYFGGEGRDSGRDVALYEGAGGLRVYLLGATDSERLPGVGEGAYQATPGGAGDVFVARFNDRGERLYATYLGGEGEDWGAALAVDPASGDVALAAHAASDGLASAGAWDGRREGGMCVFNRRDPRAIPHPCFDILVARLSPTLDSARFVTYLGGAEDDYPAALAFDGDGDLLLAGATLSPAAVVADSDEAPAFFPLTQLPRGGVGDSGRLDAFVLRLAGDGGTLRWSQILRGEDNDFFNALALGPNGEIYLAGHSWSEAVRWEAPLQTRVAGGEGRVTALTADGTVLFDSLLGGVASDFFYAVASDGAGRLWLAGGSRSPDPLDTGAQAQGGDDAWLVDLDLSDTRQAALRLTLAVEAGARLALDAPVTFTATVRNEGQETAPKARLLLRFPTGLTVNAPADCRRWHTTWSCPLGDLAPGELRATVFSLTPRRDGEMRIVAGLAAGMSLADLEAAQASATLQVAGPPLTSAWGPVGLAFAWLWWLRRR